MSQLVMVRHGQSLWNAFNVFTGWVDVPLSEKGIQEAISAGKELTDVAFNRIYVSTLMRAQETAMIIMAHNHGGKSPVIIHTGGQQAEWSQIYSAEMQEQIIPVYRDWHLNERYYGELQGLNKQKTREQYGDEQVKIWRRSFATPPPNGEALKNTAERTLPFFNEEILPRLKAGENILISAHGNSLRSIVMSLDQLSEDEVLQLEIPTGKPLYYEYREGAVKKA